MTTLFSHSMSGSSWADDEGDHHFQTAISLEETEPSIEKQPRKVSFDDNVENEQPVPTRQSAPIPENPPFTSYVGNLPYDITEEALRQVFSGLEVVKIRLPMDYQTKRPKGFAYVEFAQRDGLMEALNQSGKSVGNRPMRVDVAVDRRQNRRFSFDKRRTKYNKEATPEESNQPIERPRLKLLPRTKSMDEAEQEDGRNKTIFGDGHPRDEIQYRERKMSEEMEQRKSADSETGLTPEEPIEKPHEPTEKPTRPHFERRGSRGRGRGRGGRGKGRGGPRERTNSIDKSKFVKKKSDEEIFRKATVSMTVSSTKVQNAFSALDSESDSESD